MKAYWNNGVEYDTRLIELWTTRRNPLGSVHLLITQNKPIFMSKKSESASSRRKFLKTSGSAVAAGTALSQIPLRTLCTRPAATP